MSTRADVYCMDILVGEIHSDGYPVAKDDPYYPDSFWGLLEALDEQNCTEIEFTTAIKIFIDEPEYLPPTATGISNWNYEYLWYPTQQPAEYRDWDHWRGHILFREVDTELTIDWRYQVPGPWKRLSEWAPQEEENL